MQLVLLCVLVLSLLQPGLLQDGGTEDTPTNGGGGDLLQSITELKNIVLAQSKLMVDFSREVRGQMATINATVNSLQGQLESLTGEVVKNRQRINVVRRIAESEQAVSQNISSQLATCTTTDQLRRELIASKQMIIERVDGISSQQARIQNETTAQLQIVHTTLHTQLANTTAQLSTGLNRELIANQQTISKKVDDVGIRIQSEVMAQLKIVHTAIDSQLVNATDQLSIELNQLKRELTVNQQNCDLVHNTTQAKNISHEQDQPTSIETPQDSLVMPGYRYTCGGSPGWRRVAFLNMTDPSQDCPSGWSLTTHSVRTCGRTSSQQFTCDPVTFSVSGGEYSRVYGRIRGYQYGVSRAFYGASFHNNIALSGSYVDGISITHGLPHAHIWTFAVGLAQEENGYYIMPLYCYCDVKTHPNSSQAIPPSFVGNDYFCESSVSGPLIPAASLQPHTRLYSENPLWDGQNCGQNSTCCSMNNPPYFMKDLPAPTTDDIEVRICSSYRSHWNDHLIELLEIYVQ